MPRSNFDKYATPDPPIDWLWAAVLERQKVKGVALKDLAKACHVHYDSMRRYAMHSPWEWPKDVRESACEVLGIEIKRTIEGKEI